MVLLQILLWTMAGISSLLLLIYIVEASLLSVPFSLALAMFYRNKPMVPVEEHFPQHRLLKDNWQAIRNELLEILEYQEAIPKFHEIDGIQKMISANDGVPWRTFVLKAYGNRVESNCARVPVTAALIDSIPNVTTAMFSIIGPQKHIPPHRGLYKGVWRYHLGLVVPKDGECYIMNGGQRYAWQEGEDVLFDDTFNHEVWNKSPETRVVLFCDVFREDLPAFFRPLNRWVYLMRVKSKRLKRAVQRAEVPRDIGRQVGEVTASSASLGRSNPVG